MEPFGTARVWNIISPGPGISISKEEFCCQGKWSQPDRSIFSQKKLWISDTFRVFSPIGDGD